MRISIIIPTLNEEKYIGELLAFLQDHPQKDQLEVIVVDGGSEDETPTIAAKYPDVKLVTSTRCSRACQMNEGAKNADGSIYYFVHADTLPPASFVSDIQLAVYKGNASGCYRFKFRDPPYFLLHLNGFLTRLPFSWCRGGDQTLFITKKAFEELKGFNEAYVIMEDYDLLDRLSNAGLQFKIIPKNVQVSARKYTRNSYLKVQWANYRAMKMYQKGYDSNQIKSYYQHVLS